MPQAMTQHSPGSLDKWLYFFITQGTVPYLHQIHFFFFCVNYHNKGFRFMLVYSCLHYLLCKKWVNFLRSNVFPVSTSKQDCESGVVSLCWTEIPDQNMAINLNLLAATIRSFKMLIDYILDLPPPSPLAPYPSPKEREDEETVLKFPLVLA